MFFFSSRKKNHCCQLDSPSFPYFTGEAIVCETIYPHQPGRVQFRGSYWFAKSREKITIEIGVIVRVIDVIDLILIIEQTDD